MKLSLLGKKLGMTQIYDGNNELVPVTVVEAGPCPIVQIKTQASDGYNALQIGFGPTKDQRLSKPARGHLSKAGAPPVAHLVEIRLGEAPTQQVGEVLNVTVFQEGDSVDVIGKTKGKGFQGVVRRHGVAGGPASHGSMFHRRVGSIGMRQTPGHTFKNQIMPGHMGQARRTVQNLRIVRIDADKNLLLIKGAIPGANGDAVLIRSAKKAKASA